MEYNFKSIESKWQARWKDEKTFQTGTDYSKPKCYVLDMFPYPSGAGLHVGHPLGYIASDIYARYKRQKGYNVLHPMGYDSFGLPAEQYAIQTGQHPAITTEENIARYREQLDKIGFSFDWEREVRTSAPKYYKWTQWIFIQLYNSWYNPVAQKAESIETLIDQFRAEGKVFSTDQGDKFWGELDEKQQSAILLEYRLAYLSEAMVNWCPELGTVLANDEVKDGVSERGGYPVERKKMMQWSLRITAYADRLLQGLDEIDWPESLKESQRNWIGKSKGASIKFKVKDRREYLEVFTTRPDTIFGVSFMVVAPEYEQLENLITEENKASVEAYVIQAKNRSERERMADVKTVSGVFTGSYVTHPFTNEDIPLWVGDYVLAGYGTGAVMAVAGHDSRDYAFAKHFNLPILPVIEGADISTEAFETKSGKMINSDFINGLKVKEAMEKVIQVAEEKGIGTGKVNFRLRDAIFGRQRYWGEPIPVYYKDGVPHVLSEAELPLELPEVDQYLPTNTGAPPLARAENWKYQGEFEYEHSTMPGWAGSSWYFLRYMDPDCDTGIASREASDYWQNIDLYIGGSEHATGHLLYLRFWTQFLYDLGIIPMKEPAKKLINQGMIQGMSALVYRVSGAQKIVSAGLKDKYETQPIHIDVNLVKGDVVDVEGLKQWRDDFQKMEFELEEGQLKCGSAVEKMSKRWYNVINPDDVCNEFGADCLRLYEMFLGPLEQSKPWNTNGISGTSNFLKKLWRLFHNAKGELQVIEEQPSADELKVLHKLIKKVGEDIENFSFNTSVSAFMIAVNDLASLKCNKRLILEELLIVISSYAPYISEELWEKLGHQESISKAQFPLFNEAYLVESKIAYPISFNGKMRFKLELDAGLNPKEIESLVLSNEQSEKWLEGKTPKKVIVVPKKIVNIVM